MDTKQINVHRVGTFENKIASMLSQDLDTMRENGKLSMGLERILRRALFSERNSIDWMEIADLISVVCPEKANEISTIKAERGTNWKEEEG